MYIYICIYIYTYVFVHPHSYIFICICIYDKARTLLNALRIPLCFVCDRGHTDLCVCFFAYVMWLLFVGDALEDEETHTRARTHTHTHTFFFLDVAALVLGLFLI